MENKMTSQAIGTASAGTKTIEIPTSTAWPIILAFGLTLVFAGLVTSLSVSLLGVILAVTGSIGWFREVLPYERHESVSSFEKAVPIITGRPRVAVVEWRTQELPRARLPLEIYPISAGVKGGLAGSVVMAVLAMLYGIISRRGMWYAVNVLAADSFQPKRPGANWGVSIGLPAHCERRSRTAVFAGWASLWCDAANVSSPPDSAWRLDCAHRVVRLSPWRG